MPGSWSWFDACTVICWLLLAVNASSLLAASQAVHDNQSKVAVTDCGPVVGAFDQKFWAFAFRGIPYAIPPLGPRRWKRSELLSTGGGCWKGYLDTSSRTDEYMDTQRCVQNPSKGREGVKWKGVEDCLTVDVRSPMTNINRLAPVLVDIHGGSLVAGAPDIPYALRHEGFVVIGVRYRLNVLGFLALPELAAHDSKNVSGNYGFSDQVTALLWVQRNVRAFGGDPSKVTILGCSSGGSSVWNLLAVPSAQELFARAIPLSAASKNNMTLEQAYQQNSIFVDHLCGGHPADRYACVMRLSIAQIMEGFMSMSGDRFPYFDHPFDFELPSPAEYNAGVCIVDGTVVPESLHTALSKPDSHSHVPVLSGSCSQEGQTHWLDTGSTVHDFKNIVDGFVQNLTSARWPSDAVNQIMRLYPPSSHEFFGSPKAAMDAMAADIRVVCGTIFNAERLIEGRSTNVSKEAVDIWLYYSDMNAKGGHEMTHCSTMQALCEPDCSKCSSQERAFYHHMIRVHSSFIRSGAPHPKLRRFADTSTSSESDYMLNSITSRIEATKSRLKERCHFWRDTKVLDLYAWDELEKVLKSSVLV